MINLEDGEHVEFVVRKHWLPFIFSAFVLLFLAFVPLIAYTLLPPESQAQINALMGSLASVSFLYLVWFLFLWVLFFILWTNYYLDVWVVTNLRIISIDQLSLFHRQMSTARLEKIQDAHVEVEGILPTLFGYGTLVLYTAGENPDIVLRNAAHPYGAKEHVLAVYRAAINRKTAADGI